MYRPQSSFEITITPSMIRNYVYCPVIPWINTHYNIYEPPTFSMEEGREIDYDNIKDKICRDKNCRSAVEKPVVHTGSIRGVVDLMVEKEGERIVVEVKKYKRKRYQHQVAQLKTYAEIMSVGKGEPVHRMILVQDNDIVYEKRYEYEDKVEVKDLIERVKRVIGSDRPPIVDISEKCNSCWYRRICPVNRSLS